MAAVARKSGIFSRKKLVLLIGNTGEAVQCIRLHQKAPESACRQFKLTTENIFISGTLRRCLRWDLVLEAEPKSSSSYGSDICQVAYTLDCFFLKIIPVCAMNVRKQLMKPIFD